MKTGIELIAQERKEQIEKHGHTVDRDTENNIYNQLGQAASALSHDIQDYEVDEIIEVYLPALWDKGSWEKMVKKSYKERLIIAGALIAAQIDTIQAKEGQN